MTKYTDLFETHSPCVSELTDNQIRERAESRAALKQVRAEEAKARPTTKLDPESLLFDAKTNAKFTALIGKPRDCPLQDDDPHMAVWFQEFDRVRAFAATQDPAQRAFCQGWAAAFHSALTAEKKDFPAPKEHKAEWDKGWRKGLEAKSEIEGFSPVTTQVPSMPLDLQEIAKAREKGMSYRSIEIAFGLPICKGMNAWRILNPTGAKKKAG